jgi:Secretion system C-terminal sorting domain
MNLTKVVLIGVFVCEAIGARAQTSALKVPLARQVAAYSNALQDTTRRDTTRRTPDNRFLLRGTPGLSDPSPNPATIETKIDYSAGAVAGKNAILRVYDFLGNEVMTYPLTRREGSILLKISTLRPGIYFYSLEVDGQIIATKRLVVSR